jgi:arylsulfatase A-like enzyme
MPGADGGAGAPRVTGRLRLRHIVRDLALAWALATLLSLFLVALSAVAQVPPVGGRLALFFPAALDALSLLWPLAAILAGATALLAARRAFPDRGRVVTPAAAAVLLGGPVLCHLTLVEYAPFAWFPPFLAFHAAVWGLLLAWWRWFPLPPAGGPDRRRGPAGAWLLPGAALALFAACHLLNHALYRDAYPTLHTSVLMTAALLLQAGLLAGLFALIRSRRGRLPFVAGALAAGALLAAAVPLSDLPAARSVRSYYLRFSALGQETSRGVRERAEDWEPGLVGAGARDPDGVSRFAARSGLPALPEGFDLLAHDVLLISVETFRADQSSMNDPGRDLTPHLLAYARNGAHWFTRAYAGATCTLQSIASLFAMAYPSACGLYLHTPRWSGHLPEQVPTVLEHLTAAGYDTFWIHHADGGAEDGILDWCRPRFDEVTYRPDDEAVLAAAQEALSARAEAGRRFFGWVFFPAPHAPFRAHFDEMPARTELDRYRQELRYVDGVIRRLLDHLELTGLDRRTVVVIHGDHGEEFRERGKTGHESLYSECSRVPLIVRIPGVTGGRHDAPTSLTYLFPWLLARGDDELRAVARSRMERVFGPVLAATDGAVVAELFGNSGTRALLASADHHLHHDLASGHSELYDLRQDPGERHNLLDAGGDPPRAFLDRLERYLDVRAANLNIRFADGSPEPPESAPDRAARARRIHALRGAGEDELLLELRGGHWQVQREAARTLLARDELRDETLDELIAALVSGNPALRARVDAELARSDLPRLDERLRRVAREGDPRSGRSHVRGDGSRRTLQEAARELLERRRAAGAGEPAGSGAARD